MRRRKQNDPMSSHFETLETAIQALPGGDAGREAQACPVGLMFAQGAGLGGMCHGSVVRHGPALPPYSERATTVVPALSGKSLRQSELDRVEAGHQIESKDDEHYVLGTLARTGVSTGEAGSHDDEVPPRTRKQRRQAFRRGRRANDAPLFPPQHDFGCPKCGRMCQCWELVDRSKPRPRRGRFTRHQQHDSDTEPDLSDWSSGDERNDNQHAISQSCTKQRVRTEARQPHRPRNLSRPKCEFDSTKGYPGEGPQRPPLRRTVDPRALLPERPGPRPVKVKPNRGPPYCKKCLTQHWPNKPCTPLPCCPICVRDVCVCPGEEAEKPSCRDCGEEHKDGNCKAVVCAFCKVVRCVCKPRCQFCKDHGFPVCVHDCEACAPRICTCHDDKAVEDLFGGIVCLEGVKPSPKNKAKRAKAKQLARDNARENAALAAVLKESAAADATLDCRNCNQPSPVTHKHCGACGEPKIPGNARPRCARCRAYNDDTHKHCGACGVQRHAPNCAFCAQPIEREHVFCANCGLTRHGLRHIGDLDKAQVTDELVDAAVFVRPLAAVARFRIPQVPPLPPRRAPPPIPRPHVAFAHIPLRPHFAQARLNRGFAGLARDRRIVPDAPPPPRPVLPPPARPPPDPFPWAARGGPPRFPVPVPFIPPAFVMPRVNQNLLGILKTIENEVVRRTSNLDTGIQLNREAIERLVQAKAEQLGLQQAMLKCGVYQGTAADHVNAITARVMARTVAMPVRLLGAVAQPNDPSTQPAILHRVIWNPYLATYIDALRGRRGRNFYHHVDSMEELDSAQRQAYIRALPPNSIRNTGSTRALRICEWLGRSTRTIIGVALEEGFKAFCAYVAGIYAERGAVRVDNARNAFNSEGRIYPRIYVESRYALRGYGILDQPPEYYTFWYHIRQFFYERSVVQFFRGPAIADEPFPQLPQLVETPTLVLAARAVGGLAASVVLAAIETRELREFTVRTAAHFTLHRAGLRGILAHTSWNLGAHATGNARYTLDLREQHQEEDDSRLGATLSDRCLQHKIPCPTQDAFHMTPPTEFRCKPGFGTRGYLRIAHLAQFVNRQCSHNIHLATCERVGKKLPHHDNPVAMAAVDAKWQSVHYIARILGRRVQRVQHAVPFYDWVRRLDPGKRKVYTDIYQKRTEYPTHIGTASAFIKVEKAAVLLDDQCKIGVPRTISASRPEHTLATGRWITQLAKNMTEGFRNPGIVPGGGGEIVYTCGLRASEIGAEYARLLNKIHLKPTDRLVIIEDDQSRFDLHMGQSTFDALDQYYQQVLPKRVRRLLTRGTSTGRYRDGTFYSVPATMQSGLSDTSVGTTTTNAIMKTSIHGLFRNWASIICGDDSVTITTEAELTRLGGIDGIRRSYAEFGMEVEVSASFNPLDVEFCSGRFMPHQGGYLLVPKVGKLIGRAYWDMADRRPFMQAAWMRGASHSLHAVNPYDPLVRELSRTMLSRLGSGRILRDPHNLHSPYQPYSASDQEQPISWPDVCVYYIHHYGFGYEHIQELITTLRQAAPGAHLDTPLLRELVRRDTPW